MKGGAGTPVPDLSIEVDDLECALVRFKEAQMVAKVVRSRVAPAIADAIDRSRAH